jgi:hypothetical protein
MLSGRPPNSEAGGGLTALARELTFPFAELSMSRDPNDDRSDTMNPNNDAYWASLENHSNQLNPNNERYQGPDDDDAK